MRTALTDHAANGNTLRQVVFLTDGCIGNEQQLFDIITSMRGRSRVFMVGIGSAPNTYLMTRAAELGRGTYTHIGSVEQVESRMRELFGKLENPAVTQLSVTFSDTNADMTPAVLPDLYRGEPLVRAAKLGKLAGTMEIKGRIGDRPWKVTLPLANAAEGRGLFEALGAAQDHRRGSRANHAHADGRRSQQSDPCTRARASIGDAADQPDRGRPDAEPPGGRGAEGE
jgi:Ca-activated chloride channel homolog